MRNILSTLIVLSLLVVLCVPELNGASPPSVEMTMTKIIDFADSETQPSWLIVNDGVMGGRSSSSMRVLDDGAAEFSGVLSLENNGGFASTRTVLSGDSLGDYDGLMLRVKGDGRTYQFRLRTNSKLDGVTYRQEFQTKNGEWIEIALPFTGFVASFRGRLLPEIGPLNASEIEQVGFLVADKQPGPFTLTIAWIAAYRVGQSQGNTGMTSER